MTIRAALSAELTDAMRRRDTAAARALRSSLAAVANAEAPPRVHLTDDQVRAIVTREHAELVGHAERLTRLCRRDEADAARRAADCLAAVLAADASRPDAG